MKTKRLVSALAIAVITAGLGVTANAATQGSSTSNFNNRQQMGFGKMSGMKGQDDAKEVIKNLTGMTDEEISTAIESGTRLHDLATEKGISDEDFKTAMTEQRNNSIDEAVANGDLTEEQATQMKEHMQEMMENGKNFDGAKGHNGKGNMFGLKGKDDVREVVKTLTGMTDEEITAAIESGTKLHDLVTEKGISDEDFRAAMTEQRNKSIDEAVANGDLTEEQATQMKEHMQNRENFEGAKGNKENKGNRGQKGKGLKQNKNCTATVTEESAE